MQKYDSIEVTNVPPFPISISLGDAVDHLFQAAVMLLGDEQDAALVVEQAVSQVAIDPCAGLDIGATGLADQVVLTSIARMQEAGNALDAPSVYARDGAHETCIESDDLVGGGIGPEQFQEQLQKLIEGPCRAKLRGWLEQLSPSLRTVFVLRAVLGCGNQRAATILREGKAAGWTAEQVSISYRQALCSLATSLVNSTRSRAPLMA
jgi:hypothetical protein